MQDLQDKESQRRRIWRHVLVVGLAAVGLVVGMVAGQVVGVEGTGSYCSFQYAGNDPKVENCATTIKVSYTIFGFTLETFYYECVPCPPEAAPCNTGGGLQTGSTRTAEPFHKPGTTSA